MGVINSIAASIGMDPDIFAGFLVFLGLGAIVAFVRMFCEELMPFARFVDKISEGAGVIANWLVLIACLISAGNAVSRYAINVSSNAFLEIQWYMFAGIVLLGAAYTLRVNEHVRVDLFYGALTDRQRHWVDLLGGAFFLMPMCIILVWFTWPWFIESWQNNETSTNAGGLVRWPVKLLLPVAFVLLFLQGFAEMIKRAAALKGVHNHEFAYEKPLQ
jgi:TRAP-type mannitol/chloroaromatic compound transport system permease small subunit